MKLKDLILDRLEISMSKFCKEVGLSRQTIDNIMNDKNKNGASLVTIKKICKYFDVDFHDYI